MRMDFFKDINEYLANLKSAIDNLDRGQLSNIADLLIDAYKREATVFVFGNGGSALTASHFACDINKGVSYDLEKRWKVIALTDNVATVLAYANDVSYDVVFVEQIKNFFRKGDLAIGISGSGNSENVIRAIEYVNSAGGITIGLTGYDGGRLAREAQHCLNADIDDMQISEDVHLIAVHVMMRLLKSAPVLDVCKNINYAIRRKATGSA